jgi:hypothetical protein
MDVQTSIVSRSAAVMAAFSHGSAACCHSRRFPDADMTAVN